MINILLLIVMSVALIKIQEKFKIKNRRESFLLYIFCIITLYNLKEIIIQIFDTKIDFIQRIGASTKINNVLWFLILTISGLFVFFVYSSKNMLINKLKNIINNNWDIIIYVIIAICYISWVSPLSSYGSFWLDEMYQIGFVNLPFKEYVIAGIETTPPLFGTMAYIWYRIMPYGEPFLLLLPQLMIGISTIFAGLIGRKLKNKQVGIVSALLIVTSYCVSISSIINCSASICL